MAARVLTACGVVALLLAGNHASAGEPQGNRQQAQMRFRGMDANNDGVISRREWRGSAQSFRQHDWNGDGVLSGDEVRAGAERPESNDPWNPQRAEFDNWTAQGFRSLDHNNDGRITRDEWHNDWESWNRADRNRDNVLSRSEFLADDNEDMDREDRFENLDVNNNGRIERSEWHGGTQAFNWLDRNDDGVLSRTEVLGEEDTRESDLFASLDYNRDGRLSANEWHWSQRRFERQDANNDGTISREEFSAPAAAVTGTSGSFRNDLERTIVVPATERWVDTGIDVEPGDMVTFRAQGTVRLSGTRSDTTTPGGASRRAENAPLPDRPAGALIMKVGNASAVFIGENSTAQRVFNGGRLYLSVNDDHLADNAGQFRVAVTVRR